MKDNTMMLEMPAPTTYGAVELKDIIRKYTYRGFLYTCLFILLLLLGYFAFTKATEPKVEKKFAPPLSKIQLMAPPPDATEETQETVEPVTQDVDIATLAKAGNPVPVPDAEVAELKDFASFDQLSESLSSETGQIVDLNALPSNVDFDKPKQVEVKQEEAIPAMDDFVSYEQEPDVDMAELQKNVVYPDVAIKAGIEGKVMISVLIDRSGRVQKTVIRSSSSSLLDKAAIEAVKKTTFKPGFQNKQPVNSWLLIPVIFKLR